MKIAELKRGMKAAIDRAATSFRDKARQWKEDNFPKKTGTLIDESTVKAMQWIDEKVFRLPIVISRPTPSGVDVASIIAAMRGVNWSGGRNADDWKERYLEYLDTTLHGELLKELGQIAVDELTITVIG